MTAALGEPDGERDVERVRRRLVAFLLRSCEALITRPFCVVPAPENGRRVQWRAENLMSFLCFLRVALLTLALNAAAVAGETLAPDRVMTEAQARAMLARFGYGPTPKSLQAASEQTPRAFLRRAISEESTLPPAIGERLDQLAGEPLEVVWARYGTGGNAVPSAQDIEARKEIRKLIRQYGNAEIERRLLTMANGDNPGHEALLSFWLNHFSVYARKGASELLVGDYIRKLEAAMRADSFEALLRASFFHPAMQIYLDNQRSVSPDSQTGRQASRRGKRAGINENLARELLELHTLGVDGGYGQRDVQELARIITGAGVLSAKASEEQLIKVGGMRDGYFSFDPRRHDFGSKHFLGTDFPAGEGLAEIDRALHLMSVHPATAAHVATRLAQRFLADEPPAAVVAAMADAYLHSGGRISATLSALIESSAFAASLAAPGKFKEPLDYVLSVARAACGDQPIGNGRALASAAGDMGQLPMMRTTPDGYGSQEADWLSPVAMARRVRFATAVATGRVPLAASAASAAGSGIGEGSAAVRACLADPGQIEKMVGTPSAATRAAATGLPPAQQAALLLASPAFMRR
jgi:uncharacterized protein (DUF1800 family)